MEKAELSKTIRGMNTYSKVVNTNFSELIRPIEEPDIAPITIEDFFAYYDQFFYDIPVVGPQSHTYMAERSSEYIGGNVLDEEKKALIEEINSLKQQIIDLGQSYMNIDQITM